MNNLVAQKLLQQMAMSIVASLEVKELDLELVPPPVSLTVTTLFPVMDDFIFDTAKLGMN